MRRVGEDAQRDGVVLYETDVVSVRPMELDVRTYDRIGWSVPVAHLVHSPASSVKDFS